MHSSLSRESAVEVPFPCEAPHANAPSCLASVSTTVVMCWSTTDTLPSPSCRDKFDKLEHSSKKFS